MMSVLYSRTQVHEQASIRIWQQILSKHFIKVFFVPAFMMKISNFQSFQSIKSFN